MPDDIVAVGSFSDEGSAWVGRAVLDANGIRSEIVRPAVLYASPLPRRYQLAVRLEDAETAAHLLAAGPENSSA